MFPIENGLEQGDDLLLLVFNFSVEYNIRRVHVNQDALKLNGKHQLLVYADDYNLLGGNIHTIKETQKL
jgi:hypothetical protein